MQKLRSIFGYSVAVIAIPVILATFIGMNFWSEKLVDVTGLTITPWFNGGEVVRTIEHGEYRTLIHREVFDGLIKEKNVGFVQLDWEPINKVPSQLVEEIDYDNDGTIDFKIEFYTRNVKAIIKEDSSEVGKLTHCYKLRDRYMIRVELNKKE